MTCIVGVVHKGKTWVGADSAYVIGQMERLSNSLPKIWRSNGWIVGTAGNIGFLDSQADTDDMPDREGCTPEELHDWIYCTARERKAKDWAVLIGGGGTLVTAQCTGYWAPVAPQGYTAIGSGESWALGALHAMRDAGPKKRIQRALEASAHHCVSVNAPFVILQA